MATLAEIADHLDLSVTSVSALKRAGVIPAAGRGAHDLDAVRVGYIRHLRETAAGRSAAYGTLDLTAERAALARAQTVKAERENKIADGKFLEVASFNRMATAAFLIVRGRLLGIAPRLAPLWSAKATAAEAQEILRKEIYATLDELAATDFAKYDHSNEFANTTIADLLHGELETTEG